MPMSHMHTHTHTHTHTPAIPPEQRSSVETRLERSLSQRPSKNELQQRNIIRQDQQLRDQQFEERKAFLERKLSRRPTVKELRDKHILM